MHRKAIPRRRRSAFHPRTMRSDDPSGISPDFSWLSQTWGQVLYVLLTRPPLIPSTSPRRVRMTSCARLACIRHAASVRPEPGSNSHLILFSFCHWQIYLLYRSISQPARLVRLVQFSKVFISLETTIIVYQISFALSTTFLSFFKSFFETW